jgi:hypothetical protein
MRIDIDSTVAANKKRKPGSMERMNSAFACVLSEGP